MMTDFIEVYPDTLSNVACHQSIADYEILSDSGLAYTRQSDFSRPKINQDDSSVQIGTMILSQLGKSGSIISRAVDNRVQDYCRKYEVGMFNGYRGDKRYPIASEGMQIQKTMPSQGYHVWHCERNSGNSNNRVLSWILYLNDVEDGGETEFIHYSKRFKPVAGSLVVFPAHFTHVHRGNPPLTDTKYVATG